MAWLRWSGLGLLAFGLLACGAKHHPEAGNGETHFLFLKSCTSDAQCGTALACMCGACTRSCTDDGSCGALSDGASCDPLTSAAASCGAKQSERVCSQPCEDDGDCSGTGARECSAGYCRAAPERDAGTGTAGSSGSSGGTGGPGGSGGDAGTAVGGDCALPPETGTCEALIRRFYHDPSTNTCKVFNYGGCDGNANNFETLAECEQACDVSSPTDVCALPAETGPCKAMVERFHHDSATGTCMSFTYGGCEGNANNFETAAECEQACDAPPTVHACALPVVTGPCEALIPRFYYDSVTHTCRSFSYGGCEGNANNFETSLLCQEACVQQFDP
jgi:hypothetical protein